MPVYLCPCCGGPYLVPLAYCEWMLEERGCHGAIAPALCVNCQETPQIGACVFTRSGCGTSEKGAAVDLVEGKTATVVDIATRNAQGSIFQLQLEDERQVYVCRALFATQRIERGYYLHRHQAERETCYACSAEWTTLCEKCGVGCCDSHTHVQPDGFGMRRTCGNCVDRIAGSLVGAWTLFAVLVLIIAGSFALGLWTPD